jgi:DNA-3-methyladenine glycosylase
MPSPQRLRRNFFNRPTLTVARELLGRRMVRIDEDGVRLSGIIIETEAYIGTEDQGCHARSGRTSRNASMWGPPGHAYVYFTYGMHWMLNIVTEREGFPAAVLLRAILPQEGLEVMRQHRNKRPITTLTNGPAKLCQALAIDHNQDGCDLCLRTSPVFVEEGYDIPDANVTTGPRVGLNNVPEPWKSIPWRFLVLPGHIPDFAMEEDRR